MRAILAALLLAFPGAASAAEQEEGPQHRRPAVRDPNSGQEPLPARSNPAAAPQTAPRPVASKPVTAPPTPPTNPPGGPIDWSATGLSPQSQTLLQDMMTALESGQKVDPIDTFTRILAIDPQKFSELIALMSRLSPSNANLKTDLWLQYVRLNQRSPSGYAGLAASYGERGRYGPAVGAYTQAILLGANSPQVYYGRGFAADQLGDHELAHEDAGKVLASQPNDQTAYSLYMLTNNVASTVHIDPTTGDPLSAENPVASGENPGKSEAVQVKGRFSGPPPESDPVRLSAEMTQVAARFLQLGDWHSAMNAASRAVQLDPSNAQAHNYLAMALERLGDHAKAVESASTALSLAPQSVPALNTRAWALSGMGKFDAALADSQRALSLNPNDGYGFLNKARAEGGLGRRADMLESLRRAADIDPKLARLYEDASSLPRSGDTDLLFTGMFDPKGAAPASAPAPRPGARRQSLLLVSGLMMLGGFLVAFGLIHAMSSRMREGLAQAASRPRKSSGPSGDAERGKSGSLSQYEIKRPLATSGRSVVYEAVDRGLKRRVALRKMLGEVRDDRRERERFLKDARAVAALRHPNIVQLQTIIEDGQDLYLVSDFIEGRTLKDLLAARGKLPLKEAVEIFSGICAALDHAHSSGIVHRDLKPSNVIVDAELVSKVMDFCMVRASKDALVRTAGGEAPGTAVQYMAPEAEEGMARKESDLYSLGVILYELVTGSPPFRGEGGSLLARKMSGKFDPPSRAASVPKGLDGVIARSLAPEPEDRYPCAKDILSALEALL